MQLNYAFNQCCLWFIVVNREPFTSWFKENETKKIYRGDKGTEKVKKGHYYLDGSKTSIRIIIVNDLDPGVQENEMLLLHSSGKKLASFFHCFNSFLRCVLCCVIKSVCINIFRNHGIASNL